MMPKFVFPSDRLQWCPHLKMSNFLMSSDFVQGNTVHTLRDVFSTKFDTLMCAISCLFLDKMFNVYSHNIRIITSLHIHKINIQLVPKPPP